MQHIEWDNDVDSGSGEEDIGRTRKAAAPLSNRQVYLPGNSEVAWVRSWEDLSDFIGGEDLCVVAFTAKWCSAANAVMQELDRLSVEYDEIVTLVVDVDQLQQVPREVFLFVKILARFRVKDAYTHVPAFRFYRQGSLLAQLYDCEDPRLLAKEWKRQNEQHQQMLNYYGGGGGGSGGGGDEGQRMVYYSGPIQVSETRTTTQSKKKDPFSSFFKNVEREVNKFDNNTLRNGDRGNTQVRSQPQSQSQPQYSSTVSPRQAPQQQQTGVSPRQQPSYQQSSSTTTTTKSEPRGGLAGLLGGKKESTTTTTTTSHSGDPRLYQATQQPQGRSRGGEDMEAQIRNEFAKLGFNNGNVFGVQSSQRAQPRAQAPEPDEPKAPKRVFEPPPPMQPTPQQIQAQQPPPPLPDFLKPVSRPGLLSDLPPLNKDRYSYLDCECMMGHVRWHLQIALASAQILRDHGLELSAEHQALVLRRIAAAAKEIKTVAAVLKQVDTRIAHHLSRQDALYDKVVLLVERTVALVALCQRIAKGHAHCECRESTDSFEPCFISYIDSASECAHAVKMLTFEQSAREYRLRMTSLPTPQH